MIQNIVVSNSEIIASSISNNNKDILCYLPTQFYRKKINTLIIDDVSCDVSSRHASIAKSIVMLKKNIAIYDDGVISLSKPLRFQVLLYHIEANARYMFCCINNMLLYDYETRTLRYDEQEIVLKEKENEIFNVLLMADGYILSKSKIFFHVWNYLHFESKTLEVHIYQLKKKLPSGLFNIDKNDCFLDIRDIY